MIVLIPYINLLNLSWRIKCLFMRNMEPLKERICSQREQILSLKSSPILEAILSRFAHYLTWMCTICTIFTLNIWTPYVLTMLFLKFVRPSRKHACIMLTPLKPHFYTVKLGFTGVYIIVLISAKNIACGYLLEPPRRGGSNEYPQAMFWAEIWKNIRTFIWKFSFFVRKFSVFE